MLIISFALGPTPNMCAEWGCDGPYEYAGLDYADQLADEEYDRFPYAWKFQEPDEEPQIVTWPVGWDVCLVFDEDDELEPGTRSYERLHP